MYRGEHKMISEQIPTTPADQVVQFGMLYEKYIFEQLVCRLVRELNLKTVCEFPYNRLMGDNNSEYFEKYGCQVTRIRTHEHSNTKYDLVWNFCEFEQIASSEYILSRMKKLSNNYLLVITQNLYNVMMYHCWYHLIKGRAWDHGRLDKINYLALKGEYARNNIKLLETGAFDVPWFVLDFYEGGKFFRGLAPKTLIDTREIRESFFEKLPKPIKILLAHHHYALGQAGE
jgi:hypothetical protein